MRIDRGVNVLLTFWLVTMGFICLMTIILIVVIIIATFFSSYHYASALNMTSNPQKLSIHLSSGSDFVAGSLIISLDQTNLEQQMQTQLLNHARTIGKANVYLINGSMISSKPGRNQDMRSIADTMIIFYQLHFNKICSTRICQEKIKQFSLILFRRMKLNLSQLITNIPSSTLSEDIVTGNIDLISEYWSKFRPYHENPFYYFGVFEPNLPESCQIEQVHILHRHGSKFPSDIEALLIKSFHEKMINSEKTFTGPLSFLNVWSLRFGTDDLVSIGKSESYGSGANFRTNYEENLVDKTNQTKPILRSTTVSNVRETTRTWAAGFFGLDQTDHQYTLLEIPMTNQNNTLNSRNSCRNFADRQNHLRDFENILIDFPQLFLTEATERLRNYVPSELTINVSDTFAMQLLCTFEYVTFGSSHFCSLFTIKEWKGFEYTYDLYMYNGFAFGQPVGRALGLGYLEELLARLTNQQITVSSSSVNSTLDASPSTFPLNQNFYFDASDESTIISFLTTISLDYFRENLTMNFPPRFDRHFRLTHLTPYAARLIIEKITCSSSSSTNRSTGRLTSQKFIRMKLNNGILPLNSLRTGRCSSSIDRSDGLCPFENFLSSQMNSSRLANYQFLCFQSFEFNRTSFTNDGTYFFSFE